MAAFLPNLGWFGIGILVLAFDVLAAGARKYPFMPASLTAGADGDECAPAVSVAAIDTGVASCDAEANGSDN